jgi:citronellol/citronellal dehydrogenase
LKTKMTLTMKMMTYLYRGLDVRDASNRRFTFRRRRRADGFRAVFARGKLSRRSEARVNDEVTAGRARRRAPLLENFCYLCPRVIFLKRHTLAMPLPPPPDLRGRVAIVTGGSRGIGREVCLALARAGAHVVVAAKSASPQPTLPGTIHTVADEIRALRTGAEAFPYALDLRDESACVSCVRDVVARFGRVDILVNNASALWWHTIPETPTRKYDLIQSINARGAFVMTRECLPHMARNRFGRVVCMGPPIPASYRHYAGKTAYYMSKCGMTMVALGAAAEGADAGITGNALWPATVVESSASENFELGDKSGWRKATILADATVAIVGDAAQTGGQLIDDVYLRSVGATDDDIAKYRCDPNVEPPRLLAGEAGDGGGEWDVRRGDVGKLGRDKARSKL